MLGDDTTDLSSWTQWATDFDGAYSSFMSNLNFLQSNRAWVAANAPSELPNVDSLLSRASDLLSSLQLLKTVRDDFNNTVYAAQYVGNQIVSGVSSGADYVGSALTDVYSGALDTLGLNGLGAAPVIAGVTVAAAIAALTLISYWIYDAYTETQRIQAMQAQIAAGVPASQAAQNVGTAITGGSSQGIFGSGGTFNLTPLIILAAIIIGGPYILNMLESSEAASGD